MKKLLLLLLMLPTLAFATTTIELNSNNSISFNQAFTARFIAKKQVEAIVKCARNVGSDIYITAYSPGGSISAGQRFFDTLNALPCKFHTITVFGASMSYQMTQNLGRRYILPSGRLMSHRASVSGLSGEIGGELESILKNLNDSITGLEEVAANRVGITLAEYREAIRDELWLTAEEAVKTNHADEIALVKCDDSLMTSYFVTYRTMFGNFEVEFSNCPIITAPLGISGTNEESEVEFMKDFNNITNRIKVTL